MARRDWAKRGWAKRGWIVGWVLSMPLAVWFGIWLARGSDEPRTATAAGPAPRSATMPAVMAASPGARPGGAAGPGADEIRSIVRDELARQLSEMHPPSSDGHGDEPGETAQRAGQATPLTPELQAKADAADAVIRRAVSAGQWTSDERRQFAEATSGLPGTTVFELQRSVIAAINLGRLSVPDRAFPFELPH